MEGQAYMGWVFRVEEVTCIASSYEENLGLEKINNLNFNTWSL